MTLLADEAGYLWRQHPSGKRVMSLAAQREFFMDLPKEGYGQRPVPEVREWQDACARSTGRRPQAAEEGLPGHDR